MTKKKKFDYFDNCAICDAMRKADEAGKELTMDQLHTAFDDAAKSGRAVASYINPKFSSRRQQQPKRND